MIELHKLTKSYNRLTVLDNINLFIQEGEIFGVVGKSGAGKSSLLRCISLLETPDSGEIIIDNQAVHTLSLKELRLIKYKLAVIFQDFNLLNSKTVYDNIALPMRVQNIEESAVKTKVDELLDVVELTPKKDSYPSQLSGGQKQRVAIARALSISPKILFCDEATSALDPQTTEAILALLKKINCLYGITMVVITHEMEVIKRVCHRLAIMEQGRVIEITPLASVFKKIHSPAYNLFYQQLQPTLPSSLLEKISALPSNNIVLSIFFEERAANIPFISKISRDLSIDITILLANIDTFNDLTCGILIVEITASETLFSQFLNSCQQAHLNVEILGYINEPLV